MQTNILRINVHTLSISSVSYTLPPSPPPTLTVQFCKCKHHRPSRPTLSPPSCPRGSSASSIFHPLPSPRISPAYETVWLRCRSRLPRRLRAAPAPPVTIPTNHFSHALTSPTHNTTLPRSTHFPRRTSIHRSIAGSATIAPRLISLSPFNTMIQR